MEKINRKKKNELKSIWRKYKDKVLSFAFGALVVFVIMMLVYPERIAKLKNGSEPIVKVGSEYITADTLYENMKEYYNISILLDEIDSLILENKYELNSEDEKEIEETADYYISSYESYYGYTEEEFLNSKGFDSRDDFIEYLTLDYRRSLYFNSYLESIISEEEIEKYYEDNVFADIDANTIYVSIDTESSDDTDLIKEILNKLNSGKTYEEVKDEYEKKATFTERGYVSFDTEIDSEILDELKSLKDGEYSKDYIETDSGYYVVFRLQSKEKAEFEDVKERIIEKIKIEKQEEDENIYYKSLIILREQAGLSFKDTVLEKKYENFKKQYE